MEKSKHEASQLSACLAQTQTALQAHRDRYKERRRARRVQKHLRQQLVESQEQYRSVTTDLDKALRLMNEIQSDSSLPIDVPPDYTQQYDSCASGRHIENTFLGQHMRSILNAHIHGGSIIREAFSILSSECQQLRHIQTSDLTTVVEIALTLILHTVKLKLGYKKTEWDNISVFVQQSWRVLDDSLCVILVSLLHSAPKQIVDHYQNDDTLGCESCCEGVQWLALSSRARVLREYSDQILTIRNNLREEIPATVGFRFLHKSSELIHKSLKHHEKLLGEVPRGHCLNKILNQERHRPAERVLNSTSNIKRFFGRYRARLESLLLSISTGVID